MRFKSPILTGTVALLLIGASIAPAYASIVLSGTRVVFDAKASEKTLRLSNKGPAPSLVQAWLDAGEAQADRSALSLPFIVSPPMARIDPTKSQTLRIIHTGEALPQNQESLFWLNVLEVPPKPDTADGRSFLQLSLRTRIKLFYRPPGLPGNAIEAPGQVTWKVANQAGKTILQAVNPTPFHISFSAIELATGSQLVPVQDPNTMHPFETRAFSLPKSIVTSPASFVRYKFVNDYGGAGSGEAKLRDASR